MSNAGIPLKVIATYSGHRDLAQLNAYLEVKDEQVLGAAASLSMLSPVMGDVGNVAFSTPHNSTRLQSNLTSH
jgi:integrase/recombinase XerD